MGNVPGIRMRGSRRADGVAYRKRGHLAVTGIISFRHNRSIVSHELPSQSDWITRVSRTLVQLGYMPALVLVTVVLVPIFAMLAPLLVMALGKGSPTAAAQIGALSALILVPTIGGFVLKLLFQLERARARLAVLATQDALTGVHNRRYFFEIAEREWQRCKRYGEEAALLLIDADNFKSINDLHGHLCGDKLLVAIARAVRATLRTTDLMARFGGEELVILLPHTDPLGALDVAERIREKVQGITVPWQSASVGTMLSLTPTVPHSPLPSLDWMIHEADTAVPVRESMMRTL